MKCCIFCFSPFFPLPLSPNLSFCPVRPGLITLHSLNLRTDNRGTRKTHYIKLQLQFSNPKLSPVLNRLLSDCKWDTLIKAGKIYRPVSNISRSRYCQCTTRHSLRCCELRGNSRVGRDGLLNSRGNLKATAKVLCLY
jgi:hypothetical protein